MFLDASIFTPKGPLFEGRAKSVMLPGEQGVFEVLPFHKRLITRLISGTLVIDGRDFPVKRGIAKVEQNKLLVVIEE